MQWASLTSVEPGHCVPKAAELDDNFHLPHVFEGINMCQRMALRRLGACMQASTAEVKEMPPPCDSFLLSVVLPRDVADRLPPTDARGAAPTAVHAPLRDWTVVWHPGTEVVLYGCHMCAG